MRVQGWITRVSARNFFGCNPAKRFNISWNFSLFLTCLKLKLVANHFAESACLLNLCYSVIKSWHLILVSLAYKFLRTQTMLCLCIFVQKTAACTIRIWGLPSTCLGAFTCGKKKTKTPQNLLQCLKAREFLGLLPTFCTSMSDRPLSAARTLISELAQLRDWFLLSLKSWGIINFLVGCFFPRSSSDSNWCMTSIQAPGFPEMWITASVLCTRSWGKLWSLLHVLCGFLSAVNGLGGAMVTLALHYVENIFTSLSNGCWWCHIWMFLEVTGKNCGWPRHDDCKICLSSNALGVFVFDL